MAKERATERTEAVQAPENTEPKFRLDKLRANHLALFGVDECTFIGATAALPEDNEYSVSEIKTTIERWGAKEAK